MSEDPIVKLLVKQRIKLLFDDPFFGNLATRFSLVDASSWCKSVATDGRNLYYNREFIKTLKPKELYFVLCHEILHLAYDHIGRRGNRDPKVFNMATDYIVNYTLVNSNIGEMPDGGLYDSKFTDEMTSEEVYEILMKNSVEIQSPIDEHLDQKNDTDDSEGEGGGSPSIRVVGDANGPPSLSDEDIAEIQREFKTAMLDAAAACGGTGRLPQGVARIIGDLTESKIDWRELLDTHVRSAVKSDYNFSSPSRRSWIFGRGDYSSYSPIILPGQENENTVDLAVSVDASGSMTEEMLRDLLSEVKGIMEQFEDFRLILWTFDTHVYNPKVFTPTNLDEIMDYTLGGGGGTLFECNWEFMRDTSICRNLPEDFPETIEPERFVMFTDGYPGNEWCPSGEEEYTDTLFVIHGSKNIEAPFGMTVYYDED